MSLYVEKHRSHHRDKSFRQATAEQRQIAELTKVKKDDDILPQVSQLMEITGVSEDIARTALFDTNNDVYKAVDLVLDPTSQIQSNEWETAGAGRRKGKSSSSMKNNQMQQGDDDGGDQRVFHNDKSDFHSKGRGRKNSRGPRNNNDRRNHAGDSRDDNRGENRRWNGGRQGGRGRGRTGTGRGGGGSGSYQAGRGGRRNRGRGGGGGQQTAPTNTWSSFFQENELMVAANAASTREAVWETDGKAAENWGDAEETWGADNKAAGESEDWGMNSWSEPLTQTKVFQSQNQPVDPPTTEEPASVHEAPKPGDKFDITSLFKKTPNNSNLSQNGPLKTDIDPQTESSSTGQMFSRDQPPHSVAESSRLFSSYDKQPDNRVASSNQPDNRVSSSTQVATSNNTTSSTAMTTTDPTIYDQLISRMRQSTSISETPYPQQVEENSNKNVEQGGDVGSISDADKSVAPQSTVFASNKVDTIPAVVASSSNHQYSEAQQKEATEAVKAKLGLMPTPEAPKPQQQPPVQTTTQQNTIKQLEFGFDKEKEVIKERVIPPVSSKKPAAETPVEMPVMMEDCANLLNNSRYTLQFGCDDASLTSPTAPAPAPPTSNGAAAADNTFNATSNTLFETPSASSEPPQQQPSSSSSHQVTSNITNPAATADSLFQSSLTNSQQQQQIAPSNPATPASTLHSNNQQIDPVAAAAVVATSTTEQSPQRFSTEAAANNKTSAAVTSSEPRVPPGLPHPQVPTTSMLHHQLPPAAANVPTAVYNSVPAGYPSLTDLVIDNSNTQPGSNLPTQFYNTLSQQQQQHPVVDPVVVSQGGLRSSGGPTTVHDTKLPGGGPIIKMNTSMEGSMQQQSTTTFPNHQTMSGALQQDSTSTNPANSAANFAYTSQGSSEVVTSNQQQTKPTTNQQQQMPDMYPSSATESASTSMVQTNNSPGQLQQAPNPPQQPPQPQANKSMVPQQQNSSKPTTALPAAPNLPVNLPHMMHHNQFGILPNPSMVYPSSYYDLHPFQNSSNVAAPTGASSAGNAGNRDQTSNNNHNKYVGGRGESPMNNLINSQQQQQIAQQLPQQNPNNQHNPNNMKVTQSAATAAAAPHQQAAHFVATGLPAHPAYPSPYPTGQLFYPNYQFPAAAMFATTPVPQNPKHGVNVTTAFQQQQHGYGNYSTTASVNASSTNTLHELSAPAGFNKNQHMTLGAASNTAAGGGAAGMSAFTQAAAGPFMHMFPPGHQPPPPPPQGTQPATAAALHLLQQDINSTSQRNQVANQLGKNTSKAPFQSWGY